MFRTVAAAPMYHRTHVKTMDAVAPIYVKCAAASGNAFNGRPPDAPVRSISMNDDDCLKILVLFVCVFFFFLQICLPHPHSVMSPERPAIALL